MRDFDRQAIHRALLPHEGIGSGLHSPGQDPSGCLEVLSPSSISCGSRWNPEVSSCHTMMITVSIRQTLVLIRECVADYPFELLHKLSVAHLSRGTPSALHSDTYCGQ